MAAEEQAGPPPRIAGCTTVALNYLAYARVLAASWRTLHPGDRFVVLVLDGAGAESDLDGLDVLLPGDVGLDPGELRVQQAMYGPLELATALKPHLLGTLLDDGADAAIFIDPDTDLYGRLDDVAGSAVRHGVALSPHVLRPIPLDGRSPSELEIQLSGVFNTGLIAVGRSGRPFLEWWASRLRRDCVLEPRAGRFVDQRVVDWVPSLFPHEVLRDPGLNVAFWNLHERTLTHGASGIRVDSAPLRHFHFSGFDPRHPGILTTYELGFPLPMRVQMRDVPALAAVCEEYAAKVVAAGLDVMSGRGYGLNRTAAGATMDVWRRTVYREAVVAAEERRRPMPPSPFDPAEVAAFERLVANPSDAEELTLAMRARLEQLRAKIDATPRRRPTSRRTRLTFKARRVARRMLGRRYREVVTPDDALLQFLLDLDRRLGRAVTVPDGAGDDLRRASEGFHT